MPSSTCTISDTSLKDTFIELILLFQCLDGNFIFERYVAYNPVESLLSEISFVVKPVANPTNVKVSLSTSPGGS